MKFIDTENDERFKRIKNQTFSEAAKKCDPNEDLTSAAYDEMTDSIKNALVGHDMRMCASALLDIMMDCAAQILRDSSVEYRAEFINTNIKDIYDAFLALERALNEN